MVEKSLNVTGLLLGLKIYDNRFRIASSGLQRYVKEGYGVDINFSYEWEEVPQRALSRAMERRYDIFFIDGMYDTPVIAGKPVSEILRERNPGVFIVGMSMMGQYIEKDRISRGIYDFPVSSQNIDSSWMALVLEKGLFIPSRGSSIEVLEEKRLERWLGAIRLLPDARVYLEEEGW